MGRRNFHGAVVTLGDCVQADYLVMVRCDGCNAEKQMHPYKLIAVQRNLTGAALGALLPGFFCKTCRKSVNVIIACTYRRSGEM